LTERGGSCHCGNLVLRLCLAQTPEDTPLRACGCLFCRVHNTCATSDPRGSLVEIWAEHWSLVEPYRFRLGYCRLSNLRAVRCLYRRRVRNDGWFPRSHQHQLSRRSGRFYSAARSHGSRE
jgi:hypothetical protein